MGDCIFCKIVRREIPAKVCAETSKVLAFHDISPQAPVHVLIIPKEHLANAMEFNPSHSATLSEMFTQAQELAKSLGVAESGFRLVINNGKDGGQAVDHVHLHLLGKRRLNWPPG